ncbi:hypothetical protein [Zhongshania borealis]|uniref:Uncharacterized protein n=1 Tax=Zhongshania borealis TaxID=889488 RepID=A0ABP7WRY9_9GAMM
MFYKILGWVSIVVSILILAPSFVPGAISILASYIALLAILASIITIKSGSILYFKITASISAVNIFVVNDGLRIYGSLPEISWLYKVSIYCAFIATCALTIVYSKKFVGAIKN